MYFVLHFGFTEVCLKKKKLTTVGSSIYIVYFFQHLQNNLQLIIPVTSLHGKVIYSFSYGKGFQINV